MQCDECGSNRVVPRDVEGVALHACLLCGHLHGDLAEIARIEELREGEAAGYDRRIYPLVKTLSMMPGFRVVGASPGVASTEGMPAGTPPFVHFKIHGPKCRNYLERLMTSLMLANRSYEVAWMVEVSLVKGLTFTLMPRLEEDLAERLSRARIEACRAGVLTLSNRIRRDMNLSWWHELPDDDA